MILTIDIGGTNIKYGLCDASGNIQQKGEYPNVIKLRNDEPSRYYCLDGVFI